MNTRLNPRLGLGLAAVALCAIVFFASCGSKETTEPQVLVVLTPDSTGVDLCGIFDIAAEVENAEDTRIDWYVNDILGGNDSLGTISQTNPAVYRAPSTVPHPADVAVRAVPEADPAQEAFCVITFKSTSVARLYVNASIGSDETGTGCPGKPLKTITRALAVADSGMTIQVAPGLYDVANGEHFPIQLRSGISLVGENWETTIIRAGSLEVSMAVSLGRSHCALRKFTLEKEETLGDEFTAFVSTGPYNSDGLVDSIRVHQRANWSVMHIQGAHNTTVQNCYFVVEDGLHNSHGFQVVFGALGTVIRNCTVRGFGNGLFFNTDVDPLIEGCTLEDNSRGAWLCCGGAGSNPNPDFGGGARGSAGDNIIRNNLACGITNSGSSTVYAKYNTWTDDPPVAGHDYCNEGTGSIIVQ